MSKKKWIILVIVIYLIVHVTVQRVYNYVQEQERADQAVSVLREEYRKGYQAGLEYVRVRVATGGEFENLPDENNEDAYTIGYISGLADGCQKTTLDCSQAEELLRIVTARVGEENLERLKQYQE